MLGRRGFYFVGDSAYSLKSFLLTPYDNVMHGSHEDNYNFFHSSSRITFECAFGEVDLRWGIFWKPLRFSLVQNFRVIDAAMRLHNFIVDFRENTKESTIMEEIEREVFDDGVRRFLDVHPNVEDSGVHIGEEYERLDAEGSPLTGRRPFKAEVESKEFCMEFRKKVSEDIKQNRLTRPRSNWYQVKNRVLDS